MTCPRPPDSGARSSNEYLPSIDFILDGPDDWFLLKIEAKQTNAVSYPFDKNYLSGIRPCNDFLIGSMFERRTEADFLLLQLLGNESTEEQVSEICMLSSASLKSHPAPIF